MTTLNGSIEIEASAKSAFEQWTRIEEFSVFTEFIDSVERIDKLRSHWRVNIAGRCEKWEAETSEVIPGKRIAWHNLTGSVNSGVVTFHEFDEEKCVAVLHLHYKPHGIVENLGDELGVVEHLVGRFLDQFAEFVENMD
jgi:uncharacterized membrane protein